MFESPHRLSAAVRDLVLVCGAQRKLTLARELTKRFEQVHTLLAGDAAAWLDMDAHHGQGEFVLIVHEADDSHADADTDMSALPLLDGRLERVSVPGQDGSASCRERLFQYV